MILSDRTIREELAAGRIVIDPLDESCIQPSSVDLRLDRFFRVFLNHTMPVIDVKQDLADLTELIEISEDGSFILHPGEFVLASTYETVTLPHDLAGRLEGKSSLGRLGLLTHSSLPGSEQVLVFDGLQLVQRPIEEIVRKQQRAMVAAFDPETFEVGYHAITGWYEGPPDRIYEVQLASGRAVRVTAGHNLFTIDRGGELAKLRTRHVAARHRVAIPRRLPDPLVEPTEIPVIELVPDPAPSQLTVAGPTVAAAYDAHDDLRDLLRAAGFRAVNYYRSRALLPYTVARQVPGLLRSLGPSDVVGWRGSRNRMRSRIVVDPNLAWLLGLYVAEGYRRSQQVVISNTNQEILDRATATLAQLGLPVYRGPISITCGSSVFAAFLGWLGVGGKAPLKRVPPLVFGWPSPLIEAFLSGVVEGDGSVDGGRTSVWTTSDGLVSDVLLLFTRLGRRAGSCVRPARGNARPLWQVYAPDNEHKLLTAAPLANELLVSLRAESDLSPAEVSKRAGYRQGTDLNNIERRHGRDAVRYPTLRRLRQVFSQDAPSLPLLDRLVDGDLLWDKVVAVRDTGTSEPVFDLEVRPNGRRIENFLAGSGGVFVSNTAGFVDAGWSGHLTLELSNVSNLPITLYPRMKVGQISFFKMTTPAEVPYGSAKVRSKYQGQRGPTPSRYWENFQ
jgi:dCTP deaminase